MYFTNIVSKKFQKRSKIFSWKLRIKKIYSRRLWSRDAQLGGLAPQMLAKRHSTPTIWDWGGSKIFGAKPLKFCTGCAVLENYVQIFEKLWLKNAIKVDFWTLKKFWIPLYKRLQDTSKWMILIRIFQISKYKAF